MTEQVKTVDIGTLSIDKNGVWYLYYIGPGRDGSFGHQCLASTDLVKLLRKSSKHISRAREVYLDKIQEAQKNAEIKNTNDESDIDRL